MTLSMEALPGIPESKPQVPHRELHQISSKLQLFPKVSLSLFQSSITEGGWYTLGVLQSLSLYNGFGATILIHQAHTVHHYTDTVHHYTDTAHPIQ